MKSECLIIAGEQSGEDHAMTFFNDLKRRCDETNFFGVGGDKLRSEDVELIYHLNDFSSMGITEVLFKLPFYLRAMKRILKEVDTRNCKTAILIDFQGFNLKLAKKLTKRGIKVLYYVAPQAWAWKAYRAEAIQKYTHTLFTILPFEKEWFSNRGVQNIKAVKHPLRVEFSGQLGGLRNKSSTEIRKRKPRVLLLPGSRNTEVKLLLPIFVQAAALVKEQIDCEIAIVQTPSVNKYNYIHCDSFVAYESTELLKACDWADVCIATSGTVTLATGLFSLPTVVSYRLTVINEMILRSIINYTGAVSLTNIIHNKKLFPEFLHYNADRYNIAKEIMRFLRDEKLYDETVAQLMKTKEMLEGDDFDTSEYMAQVINDKK